MTEQAPKPTPPSTPTTPPTGQTSVAVKVETYYQATPFTARIEVRAATAQELLVRLDAAFTVGRGQVAALTILPASVMQP